MANADILLRANRVFTAAQPVNGAGYVAVKDGAILAVGEGKGDEYVGEGTQVKDLGDGLITPGYADIHCFFSGYAMGFIGGDISAAKSAAEMVQLAEGLAAQTPAGKPVLGHGWGADITPPTKAELDAAFGARPVVLMQAGGETCAMNTAAEEKYGFTPANCYAEAYWKLLAEVMGDESFIRPMFEKYMALMNSRGVTSVKEMGFDDWYGIADTLEAMDKEGALKLRVNFMSQPVGAPANIAHGKAMRERFKGDFVRFSGYNRMTDGSISQHEGDLKEPYKDMPGVTCGMDIDWDMIKAETQAVDAEGFRFSLHAQGDGAIAKVLDIYETCARDENGRMVNRHSITDLECSDPADLQRMGKMGVIAEIYPQIMSIADRAGKLAMIEEKLGAKREKNYWNRRAMVDAGVPLSCGTDLPLLVDDIPESIYHAVGGQFPEGGEPFNKQNTITVEELLTAWTKGGAFCLYSEDKLGTLEAGKRADIAVLDADVFNAPMETVRDVKVALTMVDGNVVYEK